MNEKIRFRSSKEKRKNLILSLIALLIAILFLFPLYWLICMSFKSDAESFGKIVTYYPHNFTVSPWLENFRDKDFVLSLRNSFVIAFCSMCISMVFGVTAAYGMGRYKIPGHKGFMLSFLITQMLPASLTLTPMYLIFSRLNLLGTFIGPALAIASGTVPFIVVTLRPYFKSVPTALDDAALSLLTDAWESQRGGAGAEAHRPRPRHNRPHHPRRPGSGRPYGGRASPCG